MNVLIKKIDRIPFAGFNLNGCDLKGGKVLVANAVINHMH